MHKSLVKVLGAVFLLLANVMLLAHTVIPHGHGAPELCAGCMTCPQISVTPEAHCSDAHNAQGHEHTGNCAVDDLYSRSESDDRHENCTCCIPPAEPVQTYEYNVALTPILCFSGVCLSTKEQIPIALAMKAIGLRGPPICRF